MEARILPAVLVAGEPRGVPLAQRLRQERIPAISIAVFNDYRLDWAKAYGIADLESGAPATIDTLFAAGSISKPVSALAALLAVARGKLSLDAPINDALTSWKLPENALTKKTPVTLAQLLSHTAGTTVHGFAGYLPGTPLPTLPQILDGAPPANTPAVRVDLAPGTQFRYSGGGYIVMQQALMDRLQRPFATILRADVLAPLGMTASGFEQPLPAARAALAAAGYDAEGKVIDGKRNVYPELAAAGLWTTPRDLARFFLALQAARAGRPSPVPPAIAAQMTTTHFAGGPFIDVALGTFLNDATHTFGHNGADAGFQAYASASLERGYGIVIMANSDNGFAVFDEIARTVAAEYGWAMQPPTIARHALSPARLAQLAGRFAHGIERPLTIVVRGATLALRRPFAADSELIPVDDHVLVDVASGARLTVDDAAQTIAIAHPEGALPTATRVADDVRIPILELDAGRYDDALRDYLALQKTTPQSPALDEDFLNDLGLGRMFAKSYAQAIDLLRVNVALHPDSMNTYDSLGEAYVHAGDHAQAIATFEAGLRCMTRDQTTPAAAKTALQKNADKRLRELRNSAPR
ncbi:MAG TPA: serine hydrolase [Polyangia bacterium]|nr:serine hydrolase [Polyangia bacterium]